MHSPPMANRTAVGGVCLCFHPPTHLKLLFPPPNASYRGTARSSIVWLCVQLSWSSGWYVVQGHHLTLSSLELTAMPRCTVGVGERARPRDRPLGLMPWRRWNEISGGACPLCAPVVLLLPVAFSSEFAANIKQVSWSYRKHPRLSWPAHIIATMDALL